MVDVAKLAQLGGVRKYSTDEVFFNAGDPGHEMFIILRGKIGVFIDSIDGFPIPVAELGPGDFFGEMSLLEGMPRSATIQATEDTIVIVINENNFEQVIAQQPKIAYRIMKGMSSRLRQQNEELGKLKEGTAADESESQDEDRSPKAITQPAGTSLFPPGHKSYPVLAAASDDNLLFDRNITCPICEQSFSEKGVRSSKLRLNTVDPDLRQRFTDFEPLWYMVWVCPHCYYANFNFEFKQVPDAYKKPLLEQGKVLKSKVRLNFSSPRKIDEVFLAYYLMLQTLQVGKQDPSKNAKVWLRLAWLYDDVGDKEMLKVASQHALEMFKDSFYNQRRDTSIEQDQRLSLLLGELSLKLGEDLEAANFFRGAIARKGGNATINRQAEDRIQELKTRIRMEEEEAEPEPKKPEKKKKR